MNDKLVARWERGRHWVELRQYVDGCFHYTAPDAGGVIGMLPSVEAAITKLQGKIDTGYFLPDAAKRSMKRTV